LRRVAERVRPPGVLVTRINLWATRRMG
jgi:hypothetical protein